MIVFVIAASKFVAVVEKDVSSDHRNFFSDREIGFREEFAFLSRLGNRRIGFRLQVVDQNCVPLSTFSIGKTSTFSARFTIL